MKIQLVTRRGTVVKSVECGEIPDESINQLTNFRSAGCIILNVPGVTRLGGVEERFYNPSAIEYIRILGDDDE